jgi:hypothetical protein
MWQYGRWLHSEADHFHVTTSLPGLDTSRTDLFHRDRSDHCGALAKEFYPRNDPHGRGDGLVAFIFFFLITLIVAIKVNISTGVVSVIAPLTTTITER